MTSLEDCINTQLLVVTFEQAAFEGGAPWHTYGPGFNEPLTSTNSEDARAEADAIFLSLGHKRISNWQVNDTCIIVMSI